MLVYHEGHKISMLTGEPTDTEPASTLIPPSSWSVPDPALFWNITLLWGILDRIVSDWRAVASRYQRRIDTATKHGGEKGASSAFNALYNEIKSYFVQHLFSYITFFLMLEDAYDCIYRNLNELNKEPFLQLKHGTPPLKPAMRDKIDLVRNKSIAHLGDRIKNKSLPPFTAELDSGDVIDSICGLIWDLAYPTKRNGAAVVEDMIFGATGTIRENRLKGEVFQPQDRMIGPIPSMHNELVAYLTIFDEVCADYLSAIRGKLPIEIDKTRYS